MDRRSFLRSLAALAALGAAGPSSVARALGGPETVTFARVRPGSRIELLASSFDLTEHGRDGFVDAVLWPGDRERLDRLGFSYQVLVDDLGAHDLRVRAAEARTQLADPGRRHTYRTYAEHVADMEALEARRPDIARVFTLPHPTHEKRTVIGIEIGGPDVARAALDGRPSAMIDGLHHAREWPAAEVPMMFAEDLVSSYDAGDPAIVELLDAIRVIIVPVVNPDGYVRSRETISDFIVPAPHLAAFSGEFAYHRKNLRKNTERPIEVAQGVDLNRNYAFRWGQAGTSWQTSSQTYHGPSRASEPCTQNIMGLIGSNHLLTHITNHTFGDLVLRPWGHTWNDAPDEPQLRALGDAMGAVNGYASQKGIALYPTSGTTEDYSYALAGGLAYTFEIGGNGWTFFGNISPLEEGGFHPHYDTHMPAFYAENKGAYLLALQAARDETLHAVLTGTAPPGSELTTTKVVTPPFDSGGRPPPQTLRGSMVVGPSGTFRWHVNPSPQAETLDAVQRGAQPAGALEPYTVEARHPDGTIRRATVVALRGGVYSFDLS